MSQNCMTVGWKKNVALASSLSLFIYFALYFCKSVEHSFSGLATGTQFNCWHRKIISKQTSYVYNMHIIFINVKLYSDDFFYPQKQVLNTTLKYLASVVYCKNLLHPCEKHSCGKLLVNTETNFSKENIVKAVKIIFKKTII